MQLRDLRIGPRLRALLRIRHHTLHLLTLPARAKRLLSLGGLGAPHLGRTIARCASFEDLRLLRRREHTQHVPISRALVTRQDGRHDATNAAARHAPGQLDRAAVQPFGGVLVRW